MSSNTTQTSFKALEHTVILKYFQFY